MPVSRAILAKFTAAGLGAVAAADARGLRARITEIAIGRGVAAGGGAFTGYTPLRSQTALVAEFMRAPISQVDDIADNEVLLSAVFEAAPSGPEGFIYEVGFFLDTGQLLCVWSEPGNRPLTYRSFDAALSIALSLVIEEIPRDALQFVISGPSLTIINVGPMINHAMAILRVINHEMQREADRLIPIIQNTWA